VAGINPLGKRTTTVFDAAGRSIATVDPLSNRTISVYDNAGRAVASITPLGKRSTTVFDSAGRSTARVDPLGKRTTSVFDAAGQNIASVDPLSRRSTTVFDSAGRSVARVDPLANRTTTVFDRAGQTVASIDPLGKRSTTVFDLAGRSIASVNPLGKRATTVFDAAGQAVAGIDALNNRTTSVFDSAGRAVANINPRGYRTSSVFDATGAVSAAVDALGNRTTNLYDLAGRQIARQDALNNRASTVYDAAGQAIANINPLAQRTTSVFDAAGRQAALVNGLAQRSTTVFDAASQPIAIVDALNNRNTNVFDAAGRQIASINGRGYRTTTVFDNAGQTVGTVNALGNRTTQGYDNAGRRTLLVDANNKRTTFLFDAAGRDKGSIDPLARRVTFSYDDAGNQTLKLDPRGYRTTSTFDAVNRLTVQVFGDGERHTHVFDSAGNQTRMSDLTGTTTSVFDGKNRTTAVIYPSTKRLTYIYDALDRRTLLRDTTGARFTSSYDGAGRATLLVNPQGKRTTSTFDAASRLVQQKLGNGVLVTHLLDSAGRETGLIHRTSTGTLLGRLTWTFDGANNRTLQVDAGGVRTSWTYDKANQLTREQRNGANALNVTYTFDPAGNRTVMIDSGIRTTSTYDGANQLSLELTGASRTTYQHDNCGNRTQKSASGGTSYYTWNARGKLKVAEPPTGKVTLTYDAAGRRVQKQNTTTTRKYYFDFKHAIEETDTNDVIQHEYTFNPGGGEYGDLLSQYDGTNTLYHEFDALGSTSALISEAQAEVDRWVYRAFGLQTQTLGGDVNPFTFVGKQGYWRDSETELYLLDARYYDPASCRFVSEDANYDDDKNLYRYARNNPVNGVDPSGRFLFAWNDEVKKVDRWFLDRGIGFYYLRLDRGWFNTDLWFYAFDIKNEARLRRVIREEKARSEWKNSFLQAAVALDFGEDNIYNYHRVFLKDERLQPIDFPFNSELYREANVFYQTEIRGNKLSDQPYATLGSILRDDICAELKIPCQQLLELVPKLFDLGKAILDGLWSKRLEFVTNFGEGVKKAFRKFGKNFPGSLINIVLEWLSGQLGLAQLGVDLSDLQGKLPKSLKVGELALFLLRLAGVDPDALLQRGGKSSTLKELLEAYSSETFQALTLDDLAKTLKEELDNALTKDLPKLLTVELFAGLLGGPFAAARWLLSFMGGLAELLKQLSKLIDGLTRAAKAAAKDPDDVAPAVENVLSFVVKGLLELLKILLKTSVGKLIETVKSAIATALAKVRQLGAYLLSWLDFRGLVRSKTNPRVAVRLVYPKKGPPKLWIERSPGEQLDQAWKALEVCAVKNRKQTELGRAKDLAKVLESQAAMPPPLPPKTPKGQSATAPPQPQMMAAQQGAKPMPERIDVRMAEQELADKLGEVETPTPCGCAAKPGSCFMRPLLTRDAHGKRELGDIEVGQALPACSEAERHMLGLPPRANRRLWVREQTRLVRLYVDCGGGESIWIDCLQDVSWVELQGARTGALVQVHFPEQGIRGQARVLGVWPCPPLEQDAGSLVVAVFRHTPAEVYDLKVSGEREPIGVTWTHPIRSADRNAWVAACELRIGERLLASDGSTPCVESFTLRPEPEPVYNIEVEGDHCYRVGQHGLLVHNASVLQLAIKEATQVKQALEDIGETESIKTAKAAAAHHKPTGKTAIGDSTTGVPSRLHRLIQDGLNRLGAVIAQAGGPLCNIPPGVCAEVKAVNSLLLMLGDDVSLCDIEVATVSVSDGTPATACPNCQATLLGVIFTTG
jgi:RHS repeat-associated protein